MVNCTDLELDAGQISAISKMKNGAILCGEVGSGKSRTGLAYYFFKVCKGKVRLNGKGNLVKPVFPINLYIITTARKRDLMEWEKELIPFYLSTHEELSICGIKVVIDSWNKIKDYDKVYGSFFIFDEQKASGYGVWAKSFIKIAKKNRWIMLSATPGDKWEDYIPIFIAHGFYKNKSEFLKRHAVYARYARYPKVDKWLELPVLEKYRRSILVDIELQKHTKIHKEELICSYDRDKFKTALKLRWNEERNKPIKNISELCAILRKVSNDDQSRIDTLRTLIEKHNKIIVFYNFDYELESIKRMLDSIDMPYYQWNGHVHEDLVNTEKWVYLIQYMAGAEGWNCTATNIMVFYSLSYSYRQMVQAEGRINRRDTKFTDLYYYYLRSNSQIDLAIRRSLKNKKNFNEARFIDLRNS